VSKKILINTTKINEIRIALFDGYYLYKLDTEESYNKQKKSNIYKGIIIHVEQSLNAAFVEYGDNKHGFLPFKEISNYYLNKKFDDVLNFNDYLRPGNELIVQVNKEQRGTKGAALTTYISLAGCYLVLMPYNYKAIGISKKINNEDKIKLKNKLINLNIPDDMGIIVRTAGSNKSLEDFQWDLKILLNHWNEIKNSTINKKAPYLIYQESNIIMRTIRDYLRSDIEEIIVDNPRIYKIICSHIKIMKSDFLNIVKLYNKNTSLFTKYKIEKQIISAFKHTIKLISGGIVIIDYTEALISIDVNSFKSTKAIDVEETALQTNIEACDEISTRCLSSGDG
jgi:ribonuclease E